MKKPLSLLFVVSVFALVFLFFYSGENGSRDSGSSYEEKDTLQAGADAGTSQAPKTIAQVSDPLENSPFQIIPPKGTRDNFAELLEDAQALGSEDGALRDDGSFVRRTLYRVKNAYYPVILVEEVMTPGEDGAFHSSRISAIVGDHAMVRLPEGASEQQLLSWISDEGYSLRDKLNTAPIYIVADESGAVRAVDDIISNYTAAFLADQPEWDRRGIAEADHVAFLSAIPNDTEFDLLWGLYNDGSFIGSVAGADIGAEPAWNLGTGNASVVVAVIDSGMQLNHPDLQDNLWTNTGEIPDNGIDDDLNGFIDDVHGWDFVGNNWFPGDGLSPDNDPSDENGHGTHVAGTIGAVGNNGTGVTGVNWNVSLMPLKIGAFFSFISTSAALEATNYAVMEGAKFLNNSYGGPIRPEDEVPPVLFEDAIRNAELNDVLFIAAAGNDSTDNDEAPQYPASYELTNVISVAATDWADELADFSNFGESSVDLGAPGDFILSTYPGSDYVFISGTSMAAPQVTGAAALFKSQQPGFSGAAIRARMFNTVDSLPSLDGLVATGGRLNVQAMVGAPDSGGGDTPNIGTSLSITNMKISDPRSASRFNNGDGVFNAGERLALEYTITNISNQRVDVIRSRLRAEPGELAPNIYIGFDDLGSGNQSLGTLNPGQSVVDRNLRLFCFGNTSMPFTGSYSIDLESGVLPPRDLQSFNFSIVAGNTATVSGTVSSNPGGFPIPDAIVTLVGSADVFSTKVAPNGSFSIKVPGEVYMVQATSAFFGNGDLFSINAEGGATGLNLVIDVAEVSVSPVNISATAPEGDSTTETVTVTNSGEGDLFWFLLGTSTTAVPSADLSRSFLPVSEFPFWLSADPVVGTVAPGDSEDITLSFSSDDLPVGTVNSTMTLNASDPVNPETAITVEFTVTSSSMTGFPSVAYAEWIAGQTSALSSNDEPAPVDPDLDGDGIANVIDFVLGDPEGSSGIDFGVEDGRYMELGIRDDVPVSVITVLSSTNLTTWTPLPADSYEVEENASTDPGMKDVKIFLGDDEGSVFYRIQISEP